MHIDLCADACTCGENSGNKLDAAAAAGDDFYSEYAICLLCGEKFRWRSKLLAIFVPIKCAPGFYCHAVFRNYYETPESTTLSFIKITTIIIFQI